jgi:DNA-binding NtrC family response regulator
MAGFRSLLHSQTEALTQMKRVRPRLLRQEVASDILFVDESWFATEIPAQRRRAEAAEPTMSDGDPRSEREIIEAALTESRGRASGPSGAAAKLGIPQSTLAYKIKVLGISKSRFRFR